MGWYHSHPFDVEAHSHCFFSSTDLTTQLMWQRTEDGHGNPWLGIVVRVWKVCCNIYLVGVFGGPIFAALVWGEVNSIFIAFQVDPLRSLAKGRPELGAFRAYPPDYSAPANQTPDGRIVTDETARLERWGSCWNR